MRLNNKKFSMVKNHKDNSDPIGKIHNEFQTKIGQTLYVVNTIFNQESESAIRTTVSPTVEELQ